MPPMDSELPMDEKTRVRRLVIDRLESLQQAGVMQLPRKKAVLPGQLNAESTRSQSPSALPKKPVVEQASTSSPLPMAPQDSEERLKRPTAVTSGTGGLLEDKEPANGEFSHVLTLEALQPIVAGCTRCGELAQTRTQTVFGVGNPNARLCFLGEAPGADEDRLGEPFVGRAGQLLTKIIEACTLKREDVYIVNMIKCRPPGNRNPLPTELANCRGYLERQIDLIRPELICCLGAVAAQNLLNTTLSIGKLRGKMHEYRGAKVVCTYHPAFLLRSPSFKKETWEDMKFLMRELGVVL